MSEMTNTIASMALSEEAKKATEMLSEPMKSVYYIYNANFRDLDKLHESGTKKELPE